MNQPAPNTENNTVFIQRRFDASREKVFQAWTDPQALQTWFGPEGVETSDALVDLRVGGEYKVTMLPPGGDTVIHYGEYKEIVPNKKLVFTWMLEGQGCGAEEGESAETLVTVEFKTIADGTEVSLTHQNLPSEKSRDGHEEGWNGCLDSLANVL